MSEGTQKATGPAITIVSHETSGFSDQTKKLERPYLNKKSFVGQKNMVSEIIFFKASRYFPGLVSIMETYSKETKPAKPEFAYWVSAS